MDPRSERPGALTELLSREERQRVLSGSRLKLVLTSFVLLLVGGLSLMSYVLVSSIFERMTPSIAADLAWKARRGAAELAQTADLALVVEDQEAIDKAFGDYKSDSDVSALVAVHPTGRTLRVHGTPPPGDLFQGQPGGVRETATHLVSWSEASIEGETVGRIAVVVSKQRLQAGAELRRSIVSTGLSGALLAVVLCVFFISFYVGPLLRVTHRAFERLEKTTEAALGATRMKSQFLANMSHEIRTPMNGVIGMTDLLLGTQLNPKQRRYGETIRTSATALLSVLNDVLDFSKVEAGKLELSLRSTDLGRLCEDVGELFAAQAHAKGVELACHVPSGLDTEVRCDRERLRQVLTNIVGNAVKFTERGEVVIDAKVLARDPEKLKVRLEVRDTGSGIDPAARQRLFEPFFQADGSSTRMHGGTGLGLAISHRLVTLMGGRIGFESEPGKGSTFWVELELPRCERPSEAGLRPDLGDLRVLVVDDNATNRSILEEQLAPHGFRVISVESASQALRELEQAAAASEPFDLAIVDMQMPGKTGLELAREVRASEKLAKAKLLLLTSVDESSLPEDASTFLDVVLTKPVRQSALFDCLAELFGARPRALSDGAVATPPNHDSLVSLEGVRVLLAEDNPVNQQVMSEVLSELGCAADVVGNGRRAVEATATEQYALVLMDCQMPEMDGYEATRAIRARENGGRRLPIIAVTAHALMGEREKVLAAGMDDYVTKPVSPAALRLVMQKWVAGSGAEPARGRESSLSGEIGRSARVTALFLEHAPAQVTSIEDAVASGNAEQLKSASHKLKGSCLAIGAPRMAAICKSLEPFPEDAGERVQELRAELERVRQDLDAERAMAEA
ncbi:MAG: response regulator [Polyangiaceae bacterium]